MDKKSSYRVNVYIDAANLHKAMSACGRSLDYTRFRKWLYEKYHVQTVFLFIGYLEKNKDLYTYLKKSGFILIFREVSYDALGTIKGNCDADLVLRAVCDYYEHLYDKAILITSDGDFSSLVNFLFRKSAFLILISPGNKCSFLLRKLGVPIIFLVDHIYKLSAPHKEKAPGEDGTSQGSLS